MLSNLKFLSILRKKKFKKMAVRGIISKSPKFAYLSVFCTSANDEERKTFYP